jgi:hypothetical protein
MTDLTIKSYPRTIRLKGVGTRMERVATAAVLPGSLVMLNATNNLVVHATAGGTTPAIFALENELIGKGIDDAYASGDYIQAEHFNSGDWVLGYVDAAAAAIAIGDQLESAGDGSLRKHVSGTPIAISMDALDNSAGASIARLRVDIL